MIDKVKKISRLWQSEMGVSVIEILVSLTILSLVVLYVFQAFIATNINVFQVQTVDFSKMIAETVSSQIMSSPDDFCDNMIWIESNPSATAVPADKPYIYCAKNTSVTFKEGKKSGVATIKFTPKGNLVSNSGEEGLIVEVAFEKKEENNKISLNAAQMENPTTLSYELGNESSNYTLVVTDDEENKLAAREKNSTIVLKDLKPQVYLYKNYSFDSLKSDANSNIGFLQEGISPWLKIYSWIQLVNVSELSKFMRETISIPESDKESIKENSNTVRLNSRVDSKLVNKNQMDYEFGALPILLKSWPPNTELEIANLSSYHVEVLLKKDVEKDSLTTSVAAGSVNVLDLSNMEYIDKGISLSIVVKDAKKLTTLFKLGENNERYQIQGK